MRTTLNVDEKILEEVITLTGAKNRSQAINVVLQDFVKKKRLQKLLDLRGTLHLDNNWKDLREMELDEG
ncbi:MAG: type II toxin-antitoxin system VapB family antitoxin [Deltaproteobacteria bacterium]|nr:type II toxin-antitoxin system VapB family antitoxin [Deltaproteobacteria bacterium]MBW2095674.1 type II toxin-antitoxin system VapB family antitoxin [Deltaproteobacteria bacterium]MBW2353403.1 type II toxin-antitoxin system VapB family antitoxin [Deltaproteobacteria bacterium]MDZ7696252.1 type II toxin-antitoxin system VapB family antitoxin [Deltaproteobacteria bacterium]